MDSRVARARDAVRPARPDQATTPSPSRRETSCIRFREGSAETAESVTQLAFRNRYMTTGIANIHWCHLIKSPKLHRQFDELGDGFSRHRLRPRGGLPETAQRQLGETIKSGFSRSIAAVHSSAIRATFAPTSSAVANCTTAARDFRPGGHG